MNVIKQAGFTLIELVVVIVILGILAATALPKFVDLSGDATAAKNAYNAGAATEHAATVTECKRLRGNADSSCV